MKQCGVHVHKLSASSCNCIWIVIISYATSTTCLWSAPSITPVRIQ